MKEFQQAAEKYQKMTRQEKEILIHNITESLMFEEDSIRQQILEYLGRVDRTLEKILRKRLSF